MSLPSKRISPIPLMGEQAGQILVGGFYQSYEFVLDTLGLVFVAGVIWATWRRYAQNPTGSIIAVPMPGCWVMLFMGIGGFLIEGLRIANQSIEGVRGLQPGAGRGSPMPALRSPVCSGRSGWANESPWPWRSILCSGTPTRSQPSPSSARCPSASSATSSTHRSIRSSTT
jgi:hypothetical protein